MAGINKKKPVPPKHSQFKPGQSGNPSGLPKVPKELVSFAPFTADTLKRSVTKTMDKTMEEIEGIAKDKQTKGLEAMIASVIVQAVNKGDYAGLDFLMNRTIGKVKEQLEVQMPVPTVIKRLNGEEIILGAMLAPAIEGELIDDETV